MVGSMSLHLALIVVVVTLIAYDLLLMPELSSSPPLVVKRLDPAETPLLPDATMVTAPTVALVEAADLQDAITDPRWQELVDPAEQLPDPEASALFVQRELMRIVADAERRSAEENLEKLDKLTERLTSISNDKNVGNISNQLNKLLGNQQRAERPADEQVAGEFEFNTAQMHDVKREKDANGKWVYTAVLLDAAGRTFEAPMSAEEGEAMHRTMQLIKSNPLLERVYRSVVMSVMDKVLKGAQP